MKTLLSLSILSILLLSCRTNQSQLELSLIQSGANRSELEKTLAFYSQSAEDSLKLKAVVYLIENMPDHLTLEGEKFSAYQNEIKMLLNKKANEAQLFQAIERFRFSNDLIKEDVKLITSDVLIRNIELAFEVWYNKSWCKHLNFEEFCEYILPYKYTEFQTLDYWRDTLSSRFNVAINKINQNDETLHSVYHVGKLLNREINDLIKIKLDEGRVKQSPFLRADLIATMPFGSCNEYASLILASMRSQGVPAVIDFIPQWGHKHSGNHKWITLLNNNGKHLPIPHLHQDPGDVFFPMHILPKVYRQKYAAIPERRRYVSQASFVFNSMTQFHEDVTSEYTTTSDLAIPVNNDTRIDNYAFIACSSYRTWNVVDFGIVKDKVAHFKQMGRNVVYIVLGYNGKGLIPISEPFILTKDDSIHYLNSNQDELRSITLWRKYPESEWVVHVESRMIGGKVQATNDAEWKDWDTLYEIRDRKYPDKITINTDKRYQYWRFFGRPWAYMNIAEFHLYKDSSDVLATGEVIGSTGILDNDMTYSHKKAFDGDWLTYYHSPDASDNAWVGLDMGVPEKINYVRCVPRSDDNGIHYGDSYELVYWCDNNWRSLGTQKASEKHLTFDSVPENALLLLKNITQGKEERIFTFENGKQIWR